MVCKLADGSKKSTAGTEETRPIYRSMSLEFSKAFWSQYLDNKMDFFGVPSLEAQDVLLTRHPSLAASVFVKVKASLAAAASTDSPNDNNNGCDLESAANLDEMERIGAKPCLGDFKAAAVPRRATLPELLSNSSSGLQSW